MAINTSALNSTLQSRVNALDAATDTKEVLLLSKALEAAAGSTSVSDILSEGVVQVNNVNSEGSAQVANVQNEGATQRASVGAVLGDYTLTTGFKTVGGTSIVGSGDIATLPSQ
jgi:membrane protein involved in colicin uptake